MSFLDDLESKKTGDQHAISSVASKPESHGTGRNRFTDFLLTTKFANSSEAMVRRTWDDFVWMQEQLVKERVGIIVPVLPTKSPPSRNAEFDSTFAAEQEAALNRFIQRVVGHRELVDAPSLLPFFTANSSDWSAVKEKTNNADAAEVEASNHSSVNDKGDDQANTVVISSLAEVVPKKKGRLGQWWAAKRDERALRSKNLVLEETPVESKRFDDIQSYAEHLETCIRILAEDSQVVSQSQKTIAEKFKTMGASFAQIWGENELSSTSSSNMYQSLGHCWAEMSNECKRQSQFGMQHLQKPLEELLLDVSALKDALSNRKKVVYEYTKLVQEGRKMQQRMEGLRNQADMNQSSDQFYAMEREMRSHDAAEEERRKLKDLITDRLTRDVERFRIELHERVRDVMETYHREQVRLISEQSRLWEGSLPVLRAMDNSKSALPTGAQQADTPSLVISYTTAGASASFSKDQNEMAGAVPPNNQNVEPSVISEEARFSTSSSFDSIVIDESVPMGTAIATPPPPPSAPPPPPPGSPPPTPQSAESDAPEPYIASV